MLCILIAFILENLHIWKDTELRYDLTNVAGSLLLTIYAVHLRSIPFFILNAVWLVFAIVEVISDIKRKL